MLSCLLGITDKSAIKTQYTCLLLAEFSNEDVHDQTKLMDWAIEIVTMGITCGLNMSSLDIQIMTKGLCKYFYIVQPLNTLGYYIFFWSDLSNKHIDLIVTLNELTQKTQSILLKA